MSNYEIFGTTATHLFIKLTKIKPRKENIMETKIVIVLSVNQYSFTDEKTKKLTEGSTVRYLMSDNLTPIEDTAKASKGIRPAKATLAYNDFHKFQTVPAFYEADMGYSTDSQGNVKVAPQEFRLLSGVAISKAATSANKFNLKKEEQQ